MKKKNLKLKKVIPRKKIEDIYIGDYPWPNAHVALKGLFVFCYYRAKHKVKSVHVTRDFIRDICSGTYDDMDALRPILNHPQKNELEAIDCTTFNALIKTSPELITGAWIR